jgi:hypothetical protein
VLSSPADEGLEVAAALEAHGGDQALDLRASERMSARVNVSKETARTPWYTASRPPSWE